LSVDDETTRLLVELADAKKWPARFKRDMDGNVDLGQQLREADEKIGALEKRAKEMMKKLGCVSPETRSVYYTMADMLISWQTFKDNLD
jgi:hypothetical protein